MGLQSKFQIKQAHSHGEQGDGRKGVEDSPLPNLSNFNLPLNEKHAFLDTML